MVIAKVLFYRHIIVDSSEKDLLIKHSFSPLDLHYNADT